MQDTNAQVTLAHELAERLVWGRSAVISGLARQWARDAIVDTVGVALGGMNEPALQHLLALPGMGTAQGVSTLWGLPNTTNPLDAALINGTAAHALDYDDCATAAMLHPSAVLVPAILAVGEHCGANGEQLIAAYVLGLEAAIRIGVGLVPDHLGRGWHPSATIGIFGATAAVATLLQLDQSRTATALCIAASLASGIGGNFGSMTKPLHCGQAARHGVMAALLAQQDFTAKDSALEGRNGFVSAFNGPGLYRRELMLEGWMSPSIIETTELGPKLYPCCGSTHSSIALALNLRREHAFAADAITGIDIRINPSRLLNINNPDPQTPLASKFSLQYVTGCALAKGSVRLADFEGHQFFDPAIRRLMSLTTVGSIDDGEDRGPVDFRSRLAVRLADGRTLTASGESGDWRGPLDPLSKEEAWEKFSDCAARVLDADAAERGFAALYEITQSTDIGQTLAPLRAGSRRFPISSTKRI